MLFQRYYDSLPPAQRFPNLGPDGLDTTFVITEASLLWGGLFDVHTNENDFNASFPWRPDHRLHRRGWDMDVRYNTMNTTGRAMFRRICRDIAILTCQGHPTEATANHWHLRKQESGAR